MLSKCLEAIMKHIYHSLAVTRPDNALGTCVGVNPATPGKVLSCLGILELQVPSCKEQAKQRLDSCRGIKLPPT